MILTIDITKDAPGIYIARACQGGEQVTEAEVYERIEKAIRGEAQAIPDGFAHFVEITYYGLSTGTHEIQDAIERAEELANRLMALKATQHRIMESLGQVLKSPLGAGWV